jgi:hypothetical protein
VSVTADEVREVALSLPRAYERLVGDRVKFKVGQYVFLTLAPDELSMGIGFPKEQRLDVIAAEPHKFHLPRPSDMRYNWIRVHLDALDADELYELVVDAWGLCVSKRAREEYFAAQARSPG